MAFSNKTLNSTMASGRLARGSSSPSHSIHSSNGEECATTLKFPVKCLSRSGEGGRRKEGRRKEGRRKGERSGEGGRRKGERSGEGVGKGEEGGREGGKKGREGRVG